MSTLLGLYTFAHQPNDQEVPVASPDKAAGSPVRSRRSTGEVRDLVLRSARQLFATEGFERAGTREIAEAAGVTQAAIFRHFDTKEGLFEEAVAEPFETCISRFLDEWGDKEIGPSSNTAIAHSFMTHFYELLRSNRDLFVAYLMRPESSLNGGSAGESALSRQLTAIVERMESEASGRGVLRADIPIAVR